MSKIENTLSEGRVSKNAVNSSKSACRVSEYREISGDVWILFKKYLPEGVNLDEFAQDVHELNNKYEGAAEYKFMQKLLKVYFDELNRVKG